MKWFKFYGQDWLTDLKVMGMSMEDRLCFVTLLCLASSSDKGGVICNCSEEAIIRLSNIPDWVTEDHNPAEKAKGCLERYAALQIVTLARNGDVTVNAFSRRQGENLSNAERQKTYRERLKTKSSKRNTSNVTRYNDSNARIDKNRIDKNNTKGDVPSQDIVDVIDTFEVVNPSYGNWFKNTTQRGAIERMLAVHGKERLLQVISLLPKSNTIAYIPTITTPTQLEDKWAALEAGLTKKKLELQAKAPKIAFS